MKFENGEDAVIYRRGGEMVKITAWGPNALRVQATMASGVRDDLPGALLSAEPCGDWGFTACDAAGEPGRF